MGFTMDTDMDMQPVGMGFLFSNIITDFKLFFSYFLSFFFSFGDICHSNSVTSPCKVIPHNFSCMSQTDHTLYVMTLKDQYQSLTVKHSSISEPKRVPTNRCWFIFRT